jgi:hypothetical protein
MPITTTTTSTLRFAAEKHTESIKTVLDKLYAKYNHRKVIKPDPLQFVYHYSKPADMEIAGLLAAELAYSKKSDRPSGTYGNQPF